MTEEKTEEEEPKKIKLSEIDLKVADQLILAATIKPRGLAEIAAKTNYGYSTVSQCLQILHAKKFVRKIKTSANRTIYELNTKLIEL